MEITGVVLGNHMFNYAGSPSTTPERARSSPVKSIGRQQQQNINKKREGGAPCTVHLQRRFNNQHSNLND